MLFEKILSTVQEIAISPEITFASITIISVLALCLIWIKRNRNKIIAPYPPGPKGYPLIGNIQFARLSKLTIS